MRQRLALLFVISLLFPCGVSYGGHSDVFIYPRDNDIVKVGWRIEVNSFFEGDGKNYLISQPYYSFSRYPKNHAFQVLSLEADGLKQVWISGFLDSEPAFAFGDALNNGKRKILFIRERHKESESDIKSIDDKGQIAVLFTVDGEVNGIEVADIDQDGKNEIILSRVLKQYHELVDGQISIHRWSGTRFEKVRTLKPDSKEAISGYLYFRVFDIDGDNRPDIIGREQDSSGDWYRAVTYNPDHRRFETINDPKVQWLLDEVYTPDMIVVNYRGRRFLVVGQEKVFVYSLKDWRLVRTLEIRNTHLAQGDLDNDGTNEIIILTKERKDNQNAPGVFYWLSKVHVMELNELFAGLVKD